MPINKIKIITTLLALVIFSSRAQGQYEWKVVISDNDWRYQNGVQALSCNGDNCTAAGTTIDFLYDNPQQMTFWHSTDGGNNWQMQDPHLPYFYDTLQNLDNQFTQIQQIDSLNVIAVGKYGLMLRTFDAGETWEKEESGTTFTLVSVHFSDSQTGIFTCKDPDNPIFTTSDGGRHWKPIATHFIQTNFSQCHSFGGGKFSVLGTGFGPVWSTTNNWLSVKASHAIVDSASDADWQTYYFSDCRFQGPDTIIAFGFAFYDQATTPLAAIRRTTDGGLTWQKSYKSDTGSFHEGILDMTQIDRDTILAAIPLGTPRFLISTDRGISWKFEAEKLDTTYYIAECKGLSWTRNNLLQIVGSGLMNLVSLIIQGSAVRSSVASESQLHSSVGIFPNPARGDVRVLAVSGTIAIFIYDMLGRVVRKKTGKMEESVTFNLAGLVPGMYNVVSESGSSRQTQKLIIGRE